MKLLPRLPSRHPGYICNNCLLSRPLATTRRYTTAQPNPPSPPSSAYALLPSRRLISISGPDALHFLQGAITANISPSTPRTSGFYAAFLNAKGRILNDVFIYPEITDGKEGWLIEVDAREVERLSKHIKRYRLRSKFDVRLLGAKERGVWSLWKDEGWTQHSMGDKSAGKEGEVGCEDQRAPGMGRRLILEGDKRPEVDAEETSEGAYRVRRYLKGVPEGQQELMREDSLPQESNIDYMGGIDYRKGCYVGQELTIRTHHRGVVRKRILPLMFYGKDEAMPQTLEYSPEKDFGVGTIPKETNIGRVVNRNRGRTAGTFLNGVGNIGLGLCRLEIMTSTQVHGEAGGFREGDEFKVDWQLEGGTPEMVKIKAFIPAWHPTKQ